MTRRTTILKRRLLLPLIVALLLGGIAIADDDWKPVFNPTMSTVRTSGPIKIDGDLSDPGWQGVGQVTNFVERFPGENTRPEVETKALITYNDEYLYVGFICYDDPSQIRATMCQRDQFNGDDAVRFMVDTYGEASIGYEFLVNPYGVQKDRLHSAQGGGTGYDLIWESAATITSTGYQVEIAVPFRSIRFPGTDTQVWKVDFQRNRPRDSYYTYSWAANDRNEQCYMCKWGTVTGIADVYPGKGLEILPTMVGDQFGELPNWSTDSSFRNENPDAEVSLGGKYSISSGMTLETYYNPDFSQIEADAAQIDVNSTIALFFPERRPFFQEGTDLFNTLFNSFYTRTVYDPLFAAKLTSRTDRNSMAFITAVDERSPYTVPLEEGGNTFDVGKSYVNMLRGKRAFTNGSEIGFMLTDRRFEGGGSGSIATVDGRIRLSRTYSIIGQFVAGHTTEPHFFTDSLQGMLDTIPVSDQAAFRDSVMNTRGSFDHG
ncbi:MAG: carbohydrate binding family 9 domain-containing protein, partial [Candidatus Zixiibacteriota bacterium]